MIGGKGLSRNFRAGSGSTRTVENTSFGHCGTEFRGGTPIRAETREAYQSNGLTSLASVAVLETLLPDILSD